MGASSGKLVDGLDLGVDRRIINADFIWEPNGTNSIWVPYGQIGQAVNKKRFKAKPEVKEPPPMIKSTDFAPALKNNGNACYVNSILQCMFVLHPLTKHFND